jgi:hypothetical protein
MMLPYVAWIAIWQAIYDPRLWIGARRALRALLSMRPPIGIPNKQSST